MFFFLFLCFGQEVKNDKTSAVLPFMKIETIGVSPINESERIFYKRNAADKIMKEFKETPVFIVRYDKKGDKIKTVNKTRQLVQQPKGDGFIKRGRNVWDYDKKVTKYNKKG